MTDQEVEDFVAEKVMGWTIRNPYEEAAREISMIAFCCLGGDS